MPEISSTDTEISTYDQFSLGVLIFASLTGTLPFQHLFDKSNPESALTAVHLLHNKPLPSCAELDTRIPRAVDEVIAKMLNTDPSSRYTSASDAITHLETALEGKLLFRNQPFISYSHEDVDVASQLHSHLTKRGLSPWYDQDIKHGENWGDQIEASMIEADVMIVLLSKASVLSKEVTNEWSYWVGHLKKPLLTVVIDDCQIPYRLYSKQHIRADRSNVDDLLNKVLNALPQTMRALSSANRQGSSQTSSVGLSFHHATATSQSLVGLYAYLPRFEAGEVLFRMGRNG